ncbi:NDP-sugar synthase [Streptomyces sp. SS7]|uniref:nucleotidyltransferase family protein n=1 Tax=Streptomyces sp. SS7 TaxID=3108485 RepID=UPI0030ED2561
MEACIIACGRSSRLYPFTLDRPKALVPLGEQTVLAHQLSILRGWGVEKITVLHRDDHDPALVTRTLGPEDRRTVRIATAPPHWPGVYAWLCAQYTAARTPVVTLNCDLVLDPAWGGILADHASSGAALTLAATDGPGPEEGQYGRPRLLTLTGAGILTATRPPGSGPPQGAGETPLHEIGVSVVSPAAWPQLDGLPHHAEDPWADEFVPALIRSGHPVHVAVRTAPWRDVGTWYRLWLAHRDLAHARPGQQHLHPGAHIADSARIEGWAWIGPGARIGDHAVVKNSAVLAGAELAGDNSLIDGLALPGAHLAHGAHHHGTVHLSGAAPHPMPQAPHT